MTTDAPGAVVALGGAAAGTSPRGPQLPLDGVPVAVRACQAFRDVGIEPVVVLDHEPGRVAAVLEEHGLRYALNADCSLETSSSAWRGVRGLDRTQRFFLLPVNHPLVRGETIGRLLRAAGSRDALVIYPRHKGRRGFPLLLDATLGTSVLTKGFGDSRLSLLTSYDERSLDVAVDDAGTQLDIDSIPDDEQLESLAQAERIPDLLACQSLLRRRGLPVAVQEHSRVVERVARRLAVALNAGGTALNMRVIEAAALLHDVARSEADHANRGAELLTVTGYPRIATVVRRHMDVSPADATDIGEAQVVFLADKVVLGTEVVSLQERLVAVESRFAGDQRALAGARRRLEIARDLARRVESVVGRPLGTIVGRRDATAG